MELSALLAALEGGADDAEIARAARAWNEARDKATAPPQPEGIILPGLELTMTRRESRKPFVNKVKRTRAAVLEAIDESSGNLSLVARRLGVQRLTVYKYLERWPECAAALESERDKLLDVAEATLCDIAIKDRSVKALLFLLERRGRSRGWSREGPPASDTRIEVVIKPQGDGATARSGR